MTPTIATGTEQQCFEQLLLGKTVKSEGWMEPIRTSALEHAQALALPTAKHDDWRFTDLSALYQHEFHPVINFAKLALKDIEAFLISGVIRLVFVDGSYDTTLSDLTQVEQGVTVSSLLESFGDPLFEDNFGKHAPYKQDTFVALNTNFFEDGAWVRIAGELTRPIHILHIATKRDMPSAIYPRCMVVLEPNSRATLIEEYADLGEGIYFSNSVTEVIIKEHASLQHVRVQREGKRAFHIGHCSVVVNKDSVYDASSIALGARISRHSLHVTQQEEGAEVHLNGLALITGRQIADTHTVINHAMPKGKSYQLHKCIADGAAHAVFSGKILVHKGASETDSSQSSRNLLLSDKAHIDTQPQLEIFNDDVKCKHGATVGQIDVDALFFLKSRGLTEARAKSLLTHAFAAEVIAKIPVPALAASLDSEILERMGGVQA